MFLYQFTEWNSIFQGDIHLSSQRFLIHLTRLSIGIFCILALLMTSLAKISVSFDIWFFFFCASPPFASLKYMSQPFNLFKTFCYSAYLLAPFKRSRGNTEAFGQTGMFVLASVMVWLDSFTASRVITSTRSWAFSLLMKEGSEQVSATLVTLLFKEKKIVDFVPNMRADVIIGHSQTSKLM